MKRQIILILAILCLFSPIKVASAVEWIKAESITIEWDQPITYDDGSQIIGAFAWTYDVFTKDVNGSNILFVGTVTDQNATVIIAEGDKKILGVAAKYIDPDGIVVGPSVAAWSDNTIDCKDGVTFGAHNLKAPGKPPNMRK